MDRSLSNPVWSTRKVAAPVATSDDPTNIASYTMELTAQDSYGNAVANAWLSVVTDQAATLIWNLVAYHVGPNTPTPIQVDCSGQASVLLQCDSLKPPVVTFTCSNKDGPTVSRWCQGDVVEVKTEENALPPLSDSVAPTLQTVDGQTLLDKKLFSTNGYDSQSDALKAANNTATAINSAGQWMTNNRNDPSGSGLLDTSAITTPHWQIDFAHPDGPRFRELTLEEARAIIQRSRDGSAPPLLGGALGKVFGDVAHFFKKEWEKLHQVTASLESDVLTITLDAEEGTQSFVIQTVKEAGAALETVFAKIKQIAEDIYNVIAEVIAWLRTLFDWQDILNTQKAFKACINTTLTNIQTTVENNDATEAVNKWIGKFKSEVDGYFQGAENVFAAGTSYNAYANTAAGGSPSLLLGDASNGNFLAATPTNNAHQQHASKCNYVMSRSKNHFNTSSPISSVSLAALGGSDPCQSITEAIADNLSGSTFTSGFDDINTLLQTLGSNPGAIFDLIILDFIKAAQSLTDFAIDGIEAVIDAVIQVATDLTTDAFNVIDTILNTEIDIPVISWLWTNVIDKGQPFTFLDVLSLIFAVLATILYKVLDIDGGNAPFPEDVSQDITNNLPWPNIPGSVSEGASLTATTEPASWQKPLAITAAIAMFCNGVTAMYIDTAAYENAVADNADAAQPNPFFYSLIGCCFRTLVFGGAAPYKAFSSSPMTVANALTIAYWGSNGFRLLVDFIYSVVGTAKGNVECLPTYGPIGKCAAGCVSLALAIAASVEHHKDGTWTGMDMANVIIRPISAVSKPLLLTKDDEVLGFLLILELAVGLGAMMTQIERVQEG
jgi:hypothetical protein